MELFNVRVYNAKYNQRELHLHVPSDRIQNGYLFVNKMVSLPIEEVEAVNRGQLQHMEEYFAKYGTANE